METAVPLMVVALLLVAAVGVAECAVYKVGDSAGWTTMGSPDYTAWAESKNFQLDDTIVFEYNNTSSNVLQVMRASYHSCNSASPIATFSSGNDSISIKRRGHHYYICGFPGQCSAGQKVDIRIPKASSSDAPSASSAPSPAAESPAAVPARASGGTRAFPASLALLLPVLSFTNKIIKSWVQ